GGAEVVVCDASFNLGQRREEFVAQPEVKSEAIAHLEVILRVERILPGAQAERALQGCAGDLVWKTEFQGGDGVAARPRAGEIGKGRVEVEEPARRILRFEEVEVSADHLEAVLHGV